MVGYLLFVYSAAAIGLYACNKLEREFRYTFLHKRILKENKVGIGLSSTLFKY